MYLPMACSDKSMIQELMCEWGTMQNYMLYSDSWKLELLQNHRSWVFVIANLAVQCLGEKVCVLIYWWFFGYLSQMNKFSIKFGHQIPRVVQRERKMASHLSITVTIQNSKWVKNGSYSWGLVPQWSVSRSLRHPPTGKSQVRQLWTPY